MRLDPTNIVLLDELARVALAHRLSEQLRAQDLVDDIDGQRRGLDALTLGVLDGLIATHEGDASVLLLVAYVVAVALNGPGADACAWAHNLDGLNRIGSLRPYVNLGRRLVMRSYVGEPIETGGYAQLLLAEPPDMDAPAR